MTPMTPYEHDMKWLDLSRDLDKADSRVESAGRSLLYADNWSQRDRGGFNWQRRSGGYPATTWEATKQARE